MFNDMLIINLQNKRYLFTIDVLLCSLEDFEEKLHVFDGAKSRKRRNLILDDDELSVEDTTKCKK